MREELEETLLNTLRWSGIPVSPGGATFVTDDHFDATATDANVRLYDDPTPEIEAEQKALVVTALRQMPTSTRISLRHSSAMVRASTTGRYGYGPLHLDAVPRAGADAGDRRVRDRKAITDPGAGDQHRDKPEQRDSRSAPLPRCVLGYTGDLPTQSEKRGVCGREHPAARPRTAPVPLDAGGRAATTSPVATASRAARTARSA